MLIQLMTYRRVESLDRLINSLKKALGDTNVDLLVSLEFDSDEATKSYVDSLEWTNGDLIVEQNSSQLGVHEHLLSCLKRAENYEDVLFLEDDLFVVEGVVEFIEYGRSAMAEDGRIAAVGLHHYEQMQDQLLPFLPLANNSPAYLFQKACANGFWMNSQAIKELNAWIANYRGGPKEISVPKYLVKWTDEKWETLFTKHLIDQGKYVLYPRASFVTDFAEKGEHYNRDAQKFAAQTPLFFGKKADLEWKPESEHVAYDAWYEIDPSYLKKHQKELAEHSFTTDLLRSKDLQNIKTELVLTTRPIKEGKAINTYGKSLKPLENNILQSVDGEGISLAKTEYLENTSALDSLIDDYEKQMYFNSKHSVVLGIKNTLAKWLRKIRS